jgi:hypothetical protein
VCGFLHFIQFIRRLLYRMGGRDGVYEYAHNCIAPLPVQNYVASAPVQNYYSAPGAPMLIPMSPPPVTNDVSPTSLRLLELERRKAELDLEIMRLKMNADTRDV